MGSAPLLKRDPSPGISASDGSVIRTDMQNLIADILEGLHASNFINLIAPSATKTAAYTLTIDDIVILGDTTSASFTLTLPSAAATGVKKKIIIIKKIAVANTLTIDGDAAETIDGAATYAMSNDDEAVILVSDSTNWQVLATFKETQNSNLNMNSNKITNVSDPTSNQDAATKIYVDNLINGIKWKSPVRAATVSNGTLSTAFANGQNIDGVALSTGDRILLKDQTVGSENGIYTVNASGAPTRATDYDANSEVEQSAVYVKEGTVNADQGFVLTNDGAITVGTTSLTYVQFTGLGQITAGMGIKKTGNVLDLDYDELTNVTDVDDAADTVAIKDSSDSNNLKEITIDDLFKGVHDIWIPAGAIYANVTNPPTALAIEEAGTNKNNIAKFAFPDSAKGILSFLWKLPRGWNLGTLTWSFVWKTPATSNNVRFSLRAIAYENGEAFDNSNWGTAVALTDTAIAAAQNVLESDDSGSLTVGNTPSATRRLVLFELERDPAHASDTLADTADLLGIELHITLNKKSSA